LSAFSFPAGSSPITFVFSTLNLLSSFEYSWSVNWFFCPVVAFEWHSRLNHSLSLENWSSLWCFCYQNGLLVSRVLFWSLGSSIFTQLSFCRFLLILFSSLQVFNSCIIRLVCQFILVKILKIITLRNYNRSPNTLIFKIAFTNSLIDLFSESLSR